MSCRAIDNIEPGYIKECFIYDPESGKCFWKQRPIEHFKTEAKFKRFCTLFAGKEAGSLDIEGYVNVSFNYLGKYYKLKLHQVIFVLLGIEVPEGSVIDHINRNPQDNRYCNLRLATFSKNRANCNIGKNNTSGCLGVTKQLNKWMATLRRDNTYYYLGKYVTLEEAVAARQNAENQYNTTGYVTLK